MACDVPAIIEQAKCFQCYMPGGLLAAVEIVILCAIRDGTPLDCDPQTLVTEASCILSCIPPGMLPAVKTAILCDIAGLS
jgi:hypothetical protein